MVRPPSRFLFYYNINLSTVESKKINQGQINSPLYATLFRTVGESITYIRRWFKGQLEQITPTSFVVLSHLAFPTYILYFSESINWVPVCFRL